MSMFAFYLHQKKHLYNYFSSYSYLLLLVCIVEWSWSVKIGFFMDEAKQGNVLQECASKLPAIDWLEQIWKKSPKQWMVLMWNYQPHHFYAADAEPSAEQICCYVRCLPNHSFWNLVKNNSMFFNTIEEWFLKGNYGNVWCHIGKIYAF